MAEETRKELAPMEKTLTDETFNRATEAPSKPPLGRNADVTFGIYKKKDGQLGTGNKVCGDGKTLRWQRA